MPDQVVTCPHCRVEFPLAVKEVPLEGGDGDVDVGIECPACGFWTHSYFLNRRLKEKQAKLAQFKAQAGKSQKHWERFKRKQAEYQREFDDFNQRTLLATQPAAAERIKAYGFGFLGR